MGENMYRDAIKFIEYLNQMAAYEREEVARAAAISSGAMNSKSAMFSSMGSSSGIKSFSMKSVKTRQVSGYQTKTNYSAGYVAGAGGSTRWGSGARFKEDEQETFLDDA